MSKRKKRGILITLLILMILVVICIMAFDTRLVVRTYEMESEKVTERVRIALITDFHCCDYGLGNRELLEAVEAQQPDLVLLGGDIIDDDRSRSWKRGYSLVSELAAQYPTFYVTGNHEYWTREVDSIREEMEARGAVVLQGGSAEVAGITVFGIDDPDAGETEWQQQLSAAAGALDDTKFSILLTHRPERVEEYEGLGFDLAVAGHAHGGQWRLPGLINGLVAPNQGFFPEYAGGRYDLPDGTTFIVSRGLARESTWVPRIFNPPELVVIDVLPASVQN